MKRSPTYQQILATIQRSRAKRRRRRPERWNESDAPFQLFVTPEIKERFNLSCKTTTEYLEGLELVTWNVPEQEV
jgi:hypothetical protein